MSKTFLAGVPAAFVALALFAAPAALTVSPQPAAAQDRQFSDRQIQGFAAAAEEISQIANRMQQRINETEDPEQAQQIRNDANQEMVHAVRRTGLDVETYNEISEAIRNDAQLAERIQEIQESLQ